MPEPQSCQSCRWFDAWPQMKARADMGDCRCPLPPVPHSVRLSRAYPQRPGDNPNCPTWEPRS